MNSVVNMLIGVQNRSGEDTLDVVGLEEEGGIHPHFTEHHYGSGSGRCFLLHVLSLGVDLRTHLLIWKVIGIDVTKADTAAPDWEYWGQLSNSCQGSHGL